MLDFRKKQKIESNKEVSGVPQGVPISAVMANVYATNFDYQINTAVQDNKGLYRRYSDDFIIVLPVSSKGEEETEEEFKNILERVKKVTEEDKLKLSESKTNIYRKSGNNIFKIANSSTREKRALQFLTLVGENSLTFFYSK